MINHGTTRNKIIDWGRKISQKIGYHAFNYKQIATALNIKNSSIHHYFPTKEDLAVAIIERDRYEFEQLIKAIDNESSMKKVETFLSIYANYYTDGEKLCVMSTFGMTFNEVSESIRNASINYSTEVIKWLNEVFRNGLHAGEFTFSESPEEMTAIWMAALPGSLVVGRMQGVSSFYQIINSLESRLIK